MATKRGRLVRTPESGARLQEWGTVEANALRLDRDVTTALVDALAVDHAGSFNLFYLLRKHYWTAEGAELGQVASALKQMYRRVGDVTDELAFRIVELGGIPPTTPATIQEHAAVHLEAEDRYDLRASLEGDRAAYATLVESVREHVGLADRMGDSATGERLSRHLELLERDADRLDQLLEADTLVRAEATDDVDAIDTADVADNADTADTGQTHSDGSKRTDTRAEHPSHLRRPDDTHLRQRWDTVVENELRLDPRVAEELIRALNSDLSGLYILFNQVRKHYWTVEGAEWGHVDDFLVAAADRLSDVTDTLAIRVHALGGVPVCGPKGVRQHAPLYIEDAHRYDVRSSVERDLDGYSTLAVQFREHIELADRMRDQATGELLRSHSKTLEDDIRVLQSYLADDSLVRRDATHE
ncbi:DNA-binding ferritin-like protein (oxidative damage protectant) [Halogranum rubrum]|uniref:DNA-binding ferritin-like protein (Oxidative damage protectant) n=1 Tax=Halogranum rubrum TaxID=553466 RepID=A0A1I4CSH0_9EURY|nr:DNA-binding ferritin-like protein (oxidative damage protectant) [Halogranum rubrum]